MIDFWLTTAGWLGHTALVGAVVLLLGLVGVRLVSGPARRQRLAAWTVRAAVLAPVLCLLPAWMTVPAPFGSGERRAVSGEPEQTNVEPSLPMPSDGSELASAELAPEWDAELTLDSVAVPDLPPNADWHSPVATERHNPPEPVAPEPAAPAPSSSGSPLTAHRSPLDEVVPLLVSAYALVAAMLLGQMLLGQVGLARLVWRARPATNRVQSFFDELTAGWTRRPRLLVSDRVESPVCFGLWRTTVLLPTSLARAGSEAELRWVFAHELDHIHRGDLATGWCVGLARALYFFVPWYWPLRRELDLAQEYLADAAAAAADGRSVDYAAFLVDLSGGPARVPRMAHAVRAGGSDLYRRVTMLLKFGAGVDRRCSRGWAVLAAGGALSVAVLLSGLGIVSAQDDGKPPPEKKVEKDKPRPERPEAKEQPADRGQRERETRDTTVEAVKKAIAQAARDGKFEEMNRQIERLERVLTARGPRDGERGRGPRDGDRPRNPNRLRDLERPVPPVPPVPPMPPNFGRFPGGDPFRFNVPDADQMKKAMEQAERAMREAIEQLKDSPEAKEQMERALRAYREAMEQGKKQAGEAQERFREMRKAGPDAFGQFGGFSPMPGYGGFGGGFSGSARGGSPRFGVMVSPVTEALAEQLDLQKNQGVVVIQVIKGSAAEKAGMKKNDVVLLFAGQEIGGDVSKFAGAVDKTKPGQKVEVVVLRKGKKVAIEGVELPKREARDPGAGFGFDIPNLKPGAPGVESTTQVRIVNGEFTIDATRDGTKYHFSGKLEDGVENAKIMIDGKSYESLEAVPKEHRATVKELLGSIK